MENNQNKSNGARGGKRPNSGRKLGSTTKRTREIAEKAFEEGVSPLEFMLQLMRKEAEPSGDDRIDQSRIELRFEAAKAAAPYMHPRLAAVEHTGVTGGGMHTMTTEELIAIARGEA